jgi:hypothetical protein
MAIGRNRRILCLKLVPFYGFRILEPIVGASGLVPDPSRGYFRPSFRLVAFQGPLSRMETGGAPFCLWAAVEEDVLTRWARGGLTFSAQRGGRAPNVSHLLMRRRRPDSRHTNGWLLPPVRPVQWLNAKRIARSGVSDGAPAR